MHGARCALQKRCGMRTATLFSLEIPEPTGVQACAHSDSRRAVRSLTCVVPTRLLVIVRGWAWHLGGAISAMPSKKPAAAKKPAASKKTKKPAAAPSSEGFSSEPPNIHRHLIIEQTSGAHLEHLGPYHAGKIVLEAMAALRGTVRPDREFSFSVPDATTTCTQTTTKRFLLDRTNPAMYELVLYLIPSGRRR